MGAEAETRYEAELKQIRLTEVINNDDYYEYHKDGRIYVLADAKDLKGFLENGEIPLRTTRIGGGPNGETLVYGIAKPEKDKKSGFGAQEMFEGRREGAAKDFYGEVFKDGEYRVFGDWASLKSYRATGQMTAASSMPGPEGAKVSFAQASDALAQRFKTTHGLN